MTVPRGLGYVYKEGTGGKWGSGEVSEGKVTSGEVDENKEGRRDGGDDR